MPVCQLLLTWLQAALLARSIDTCATDDERRDEIVTIFETAAAELRLIATIGGGNPWVVAEWASQMLVPYGFEALPSNLNELRLALLHPPSPRLERSSYSEMPLDTPLYCSVNGEAVLDQNHGAGRYSSSA